MCGMGWMVRAVEGLVIVWWRRWAVAAPGCPQPPWAYPARVASLARAPFAERKGRFCVVVDDQIRVGRHVLRWRWASMQNLTDSNSYSRMLATKLTTMY